MAVVQRVSHHCSRHSGWHLASSGSPAESRAVAGCASPCLRGQRPAQRRDCKGRHSPLCGNKACVQLSCESSISHIESRICCFQSLLLTSCSWCRPHHPERGHHRACKTRQNTCIPRARMPVVTLSLNQQTNSLDLYAKICSCTGVVLGGLHPSQELSIVRKAEQSFECFFGQLRSA